jgi:hypothetical protein
MRVAGARRTIRRLVRENAKALIAVLAVLGFGTGFLLDLTTSWAAGMPLTSNLIAGLLGAPLPFLLALLLFDRLVAAERSRGWLSRHSDTLIDVVVPRTAAVEAELGRTWPLDLTDVETEINELALLLETLGDQLVVGTDTFPAEVLSPLKRVSALPSLDLAAVPAGLQSLITELDIVAGQSELPLLSEAAIGAQTAANNLLAGMAGYGLRAEHFIRDVQLLAGCPWAWEGSNFRVTHDFGSSTSHPNYIARAGFQYLRLLGEARVLAENCRAVRRVVQHAMV